MPSLAESRAITIGRLSVSSTPRPPLRPRSACNLQGAKVANDFPLMHYHTISRGC